MAAPQVAGLVALMRSASPGLSNTDAGPAGQADRRATAAPTRNGIGWGVINANRAVAAALGKDIDPPSSQGQEGAPPRRDQDQAVRRRQGLSATGSRSRASKGARLRLEERQALPAHREDEEEGDLVPTSSARAATGSISVAVDKAGNEEARPGEARREAAGQEVAALGASREGRRRRPGPPRRAPAWSSRPRAAR